MIMIRPEYLNDYHEFMNWFKTKYPDLYERYKSNVAPANDETGLKVLHDNINTTVYNQIFDIENEYYIAARE